MNREAWEVLQAEADRMDPERYRNVQKNWSFLRKRPQDATRHGLRTHVEEMEHFGMRIVGDGDGRYILQLNKVGYWDDLNYLCQVTGNPHRYRSYKRAAKRALYFIDVAKMIAEKEAKANVRIPL